MAFDRERPRWFAGRADLDGAAWRPLDGGGVEVGDGVLRTDGCRGEVVDAGGRSMRWDLRWEPAARPFPYFPAPMERLAGGATYPIVAVPVARASGVVEVDGRTVSADGALVEQSHLFGGRHAHRWGWLHALGFDEEPDGWATLVWARPQRLGGRVPPASSIALRAGGIESRAGGLKALRAVHWQDDGGGRVVFTATAAGAEVEGEVTVPVDHLVGVTYHDPDGSTVYCDNTGVADLRLTVRRPGAPAVVRTCHATCAFERGSRVPTSAWRPL